MSLTAYRAIIKRVDTLIEVNGAEGYEQFVNMVNAMVAKFSVKKPRHNKHGAQETEGDGGGSVISFDFDFYFNYSFTFYQWESTV